MHAHRRFGAAVLGLAALAMLPGGTGPLAAATITPSVTFTSAQTHPIGPSGNFAYGYSFTTTQALSITALGDYAPHAGGTAVRLYDGTGHTFASATVPPSSGFTGGSFSLVPDGGTSTDTFFTFAPITPVTLAPGTYFIAADVVPNDSLLYNATALMTAAGVNYGGVIDGASGTKPTSDTAGVSSFVGKGFFGPDFASSVPTPPPPVPEPSTLALLALGGGALAGWRRWRKRRPA